MTMRHEITRRCVTIGSALAIGLAAVTASSQAQQADAEPKQKALISFKLDFLSRFKKDEQADNVEPAEARSMVTPASAVEPLPDGSARTQAVPATNSEPLPPASLAAGQTAAEQFPSVLPPSVPPVQLTAGQFPLPAAGQMPFQTAQSPVVIMMPAGWQPDGSYTFAPRTVMSPEVPAEHWPTSQRNPLGDDTRKGLFNWPQIAKKITNSTIGEPEIKPQPAPVPEQPNSRALFAVASPAAPQALAAQPQAAPVAPQTTPQVTPAAAAPAIEAVTQAAPAVEAQPASKALFAPQPKQPEPPAEESKTRALFSLLSKPMNKPEAAPPSSSGSKALFAFGRKNEEPAAAPVPAVVPQYAAETPLPPEQSMPTVTPTTTVESSDPELQPPAPPSVANPRPVTLETVQSDDPKMKWRAKGAPAQVAERAAVATDTAPVTQPQTVTVQATETASATSDRPVITAAEMDQPATKLPQPTIGTHAAHHQVQHQPAAQATSLPPAARERSLLGKHFPTMSAQTPRNANDSRSPWRRQAERDAAAAAEKKIEQPVASSKAILPNVTALLPAVEKPSRPVHQHAKPTVTTVAATEDTVERTHAVQRAHETSARSTDSYYAAPWDDQIEAELQAIERRQVGAVSNRRAAIARQTMEQEEEAVERQPRVPFEVDEFEQEKAAVRRTTKASKPTVTARPKSNSPTGSPSNGARMAEQRSKKSYRRLTGEDVKQKFTRPLALFSDITKLPSQVKTAADNFERHQVEPTDEDTAGEEVEQSEENDEQPERPAPPKRSAARQPVHELRQSTAPAASVTEHEDRELLTSDKKDRPVAVGQHGGRRQVEPTARTSRVPQELAEQVEANSDVVTADDATEEEAAAEFDDDEQPVRPATHIRNKHGNRVKIYTGDATADNSAAE